MSNKIQRMYEPLNVQVLLSSSKVIEMDVVDELKIDINNLAEEIVSQPAKYAIWCVISDLSLLKLKRCKEKLRGVSFGDKCYKDLRSEYNIAYKQYKFIKQIQQAFFHRKTALMQLVSTNNRAEVLEQYKQNIFNLRALKDVVPY